MLTGPICHRIGVTDWQAQLKAIFDWIAQAKGAQHALRIAAVNQLLQEMRQPSRDAVALARAQTKTQLNYAHSESPFTPPLARVFEMGLWFRPS